MGFFFKSNKIRESEIFFDDVLNKVYSGDLISSIKLLEENNSFSPKEIELSDDYYIERDPFCLRYILLIHLYTVTECPDKLDYLLKTLRESIKNRILEKYGNRTPMDDYFISIKEIQGKLTTWINTNRNAVSKIINNETIETEGGSVKQRDIGLLNLLDNVEKHGDFFFDLYNAYFNKYLESWKNNNENAVAYASYLLKNNRSIEAKKIIADAQNIYQNDLMLVLAMGDCNMSLERYIDAISNYKKAIDINEEHPDSYYKLGALYLQMGNPIAAVPELKEAIGRAMKHDTNRIMLSNIHSALGLAFYKMDRIQEAIYAFNEAISIYHKNLQAWVSLANIRYEYTNDKKGLWACLEEIKGINKEAADTLISNFNAKNPNWELVGTLVKLNVISRIFFH